MSFDLVSRKTYYVASFTDPIDKKVVEDYYQYLASQHDLPGELRILIDTSRCDFTFGITDISELTSAMRIASEKYSSLKEAIIVTKPYETVLATLFAESGKAENYEFKVFSTETAALRWLTGN